MANTAVKTATGIPVVDPDVLIVTSDGRRIPAHSCVLASASTVLESIVDLPTSYRSGKKLIPISGVSSDAVSTFIRFLYTSRCSAEELERNGIHLLVLSHVYVVTQLKVQCTRTISERVTTDNVIDLLQLARLCDAPDLYLCCMKFLSLRFKSVEKTEGWKFMQENDPWLELEILQFMDEAESRKKRRKRREEEQRLYLLLSEAMVCLEHICRDGCTSVGPYDMEPCRRKDPCDCFETCHGLQLSIKHFAVCGKRFSGGCPRCWRMGQLLRLHSCLCDQPESCKVPLCRQLKLKMQQERSRDEALWQTLVRKVASATATLSLSKRQRKEEKNVLSWH